MDQSQASSQEVQQPVSEVSSSLSQDHGIFPDQGRLAKHPDYPLYDPRFEHDACGIGFVANISGAREHCILAYALEALANLAHRGAMDADAETSDGAGIMTQLPYRLLSDWLEEQGLPPVPQERLAVGMLFLPRDTEIARQTREIAREVIERRGASLVAWRVVPAHHDALGGTARRSCPRIEQTLIQMPETVPVDSYEQALYLIRKEIESRLSAAGIADVYIASLSARTIVYKGLVTAANLPRFYLDLVDHRFETALALFHQRYSTNTFPSWPLAQPMRLLAHNGEINTVQGNRNWMAAREPASLANHWSEEAAWLSPIIDATGSDSTSLDNVLELLTHSGRDVLQSLTMLVPEAWEGRSDLDPAIRSFFQMQASLTEPWDGPAALVFSDGVFAGAALDRNGLRPLRYLITSDGLLVAGSEVGIVHINESEIIAKGRLGPGQMLAVDTAHNRLLYDHQIKAELAARQPYANWVEQHHIPVCFDETCEAALAQSTVPESLLERQALFGYSHEDIELVLRPMMNDGTEAVWSMGDDTPLSVLSQQPRPLASYFKQRFAQVTNPPIDSLREQIVMSLTSYLGSRGDILADTEPTSTLLQLPSPLLDDTALAALLQAANQYSLNVTRLSTFYSLEDGAADDDPGAPLRQALDELETRAIADVRAGASILLLSDRAISAGDVPMPMPLALAAIHSALVRTGLRLQVGIVVETGAAWDVHQVALLMGYGANAVLPYLALETMRAFAGTRGLEDLDAREAESRYRHAVEKGLLKVMSRMGLSVLESYLGAQLFECIGIEPALVDRYFPGTPAALGGLTLADLHRQACAQRAEADRLASLRPAKQSEARPAGQGTLEAAESADRLRPRLADRGYVRFRRNGEYHAANPSIVKALQQAANSGLAEDYQRYTDLVYNRPATAIRDLLTFQPAQAIPLEEVEPAAKIVRRFVSTAMSLGALSPEAHLTLTLGVNSLGARSNTGEGGEDP
ncbi:MAG TPA: glutamate synthase central domain-containing protein, partial [Ktedonobacterales bacterium]|nr:glutamate synthase central domain-containing protein [Ktedonobacterales bacterium]